MIDDAIARGSAWLVVALYVVALVLELRQTSPPMRRAAWTFGAIALTAHIIWTLLVVHHGNLKEAFDHTALQTQKIIGIPFGYGLIVNFAMLAFWLADVSAWWLAPFWSNFRRKFVWPMHFVFGFLFLNAAIVFASPWGRVFGFSALMIAVGAWRFPAAKHPISPNDNQTR